jgi:3-oxoacyl-[acyl-carrier protein] reductase
MNKFLDGKTALATGGSRGLGRAIAEQLAALGALVAINYARNDAAARETLASIEGAGGRGFLLQKKLGSHAAAEQLAAALDVELRRHTGDSGLDVLINNAGGGSLAPMAQTTPAILERVVADNFTAPFYLTQALLPRLRQGGRVINMSSKGASSALPQYMVYAMCKSGIETFTVALAKELGPRGITVNSISPGLIASDSNADLRADAAMTRYLEDRTLLGRLGQPEDIAGVVKALVSPDMSFVTAQVSEVSGGLFLK